MTSAKAQTTDRPSSHVAALWRCGGRTCPPGTCDHDAELSRYADGDGPRTAPQIVHDVLCSSGQPLPDGPRRQMENQLGHDFADVRVHTDARAAESARAVHAQAYTVGRHVVFGSGGFAPHTGAGAMVLAHELAHVMQHRGADLPSGPLTVSQPHDGHEQAAERVARTVTSSASSASSASSTYSRGSGSAVSIGGDGGGPQLRRLGANPGCTAAEAATIHQAIFNARGWVGKAVTALNATPLSAASLASLRRNFGPTYGVAANVTMIRNRLTAARSVLSTMPISCAGVEDATCAAAPCGYTPGAGSRAATICRNATLVAGTGAVFQAGCVLHESFHGSFARFDVDSYSGWHGNSSSTPAYPGTGTDPLLNADSYTTLVMDLS